MNLCGFYFFGDTGRTYNIIGVSQNTETNEKVVLLQKFGQGERGGLYYIPIDDFNVKWREKFRPIKPLSIAIVHGRPPVREGWLPSGRYKHFKGGEYNAIGVARKEGGKENLVMMYQSLYGNRIYELAHRPYEMFSEQVEKPEHNYSGPRFKLVTEFTQPFIAQKPYK